MTLQALELPDKGFFSMGEMSRIAQVPAHTLRYWEARAGFLRPARRSSGHRRYTREDFETILLIKDLLGRRRLTIAGVRRALLERRRGARAGEEPGKEAGALPAATLKLLREVRSEIKTLVEELSR